MINKDGVHGSRATQKELAELYGSAVVRQLSYLTEVIDSRWHDYCDSIVMESRIAANHGRRALHQSKLR